MARRFNTNPIQIDSLLEDIGRGELALPEFQRDFVWAPEETAALLTSVIQGYPAGSLLFWAPGQEQIAARAFAGAPPLYSANPRLVLDGQQRLTSLYQAFWGAGDYRYFVNLKALLEEDPDLDDVILWMSAGDVVVRGLDKDRRQFQELLFPLERLRAGFQGYSTWCFKRQQHPTTPTDAAAAELNFELVTVGNSWIRSLVDYQFPVVEMTKDASIDAVCHIFEKVNSTGQKLTMFELLTARFWVKGINLRELWADALTLRGGIIKEFEVDPVDVLRVIALLAEVPDPGRPSAVFKLTGDQINAHWQHAVRGVAMALELLREEFGAIEKQWVPYAPMLIPLAALQARRPASAGKEGRSRMQQLHRWYWCSIFSGAYLQGAARRAVADYAALKRWLDDPVPAKAPEAVRTFPGFRVERLEELNRKQQAEYKACIGIIMRRKPLDLADGDLVLGPGTRPNQLQRRSIFPKSQLNGEYPKPLLDSILNTSMTRVRISGVAGQRWPSDYLGDGQRRVGTKLRKALESHLLPTGERSGLFQDDFEAFLDERIALFAEEIAELTGVSCIDDEPANAPALAAR